MKRAIRLLITHATQALIAAIRFYRRAMPPLGGLFAVRTDCKFYPSCSHYAEEALQKKGLAKGSALALKRIMRCRPLSPPQFDPVP